jgi:hypothetical protein
MQYCTDHEWAVDIEEDFRHYFNNSPRYAFQGKLDADLIQSKPSSTIRFFLHKMSGLSSDKLALVGSLYQSFCERFDSLDASQFLAKIGRNAGEEILDKIHQICK